ncbi:transposase (fragment) [Mesorhizobium plurifarium]|uniref:Transposase n=1 Tax=Mesorhizobium plurifarium TaxID=69974 RepID=A0A090F356_MESPL
MAALHLSRQLGVQYKTAWVLSLKIKEALGLRRVGMKLEGQVQMDGKYAGGHIKPENKAEERIDRRLKKEVPEHEAAMRAGACEKNGSGFERTFTRIVREEQGEAAWATVRDHVRQDAIVVTDEHPSYADLAGLNQHRQVNHAWRESERSRRALEFDVADE